MLTVTLGTCTGRFSVRILASPTPFQSGNISWNDTAVRLKSFLAFSFHFAICLPKLSQSVVLKFENTCFDI